MKYHKVIIHDLDTGELPRSFTEANDCLIIDAGPGASHCIGCFGCWLQTPGTCVLTDRLQHIGAAMGQAEEVIVISRNCYGGYSPGVKKVIDRSISTSLPFFTYRKRRIHHPGRYRAQPFFTVYIYGDMSDLEKQIAGELVQANAINMNRSDVKLFLLENTEQLEEARQ